MPHVIAATTMEWGSKTHRVFDVSWDVVNADVYDTTVQMPMTKRNHPVPGALYTVISFKTLLAGSGAGAGAAKTPPMGALLKACGLKETISTTVSTTYAWTGDLTTDTTPVDIDLYLGAAVKLPIGSAVGNVSFDFTAAQPCVMTFDMVGTYTAPTEAAGSADDETHGNPFPCKNMTLTVGTKTLVTKNLTINLNNENNAVNYDAAAANGIDDPDLVNQNPTFSVLAEMPAFSTANYWTDLAAETNTVLAAVLGVGASNINTFAMSGYLRAHPVISDVNGIAAIGLDYQMGTLSGTDTTFTLICT